MAGERERAAGRQSDATAQQTRQRIVQSAQAVFAAHGFEGVSLRDIASHAGVTHGLLRHHFGAKEDIWRAVIDQTIAEYFASLQPLIVQVEAQHTTPTAALQAAARCLIILSARSPEVARLMVHESVVGGPRLDYFMEQIAPIRAMVAPLIEAVQREGLLRQFTQQNFLLYLFMMGVMPFGLLAFSNAVAGTDLLAEDEVRRHADRVIATLFAEARPGLSVPAASE